MNYDELSDFEINKLLFIDECNKFKTKYKDIKQRKSSIKLFSRKISALVQYEDCEDWQDTGWIDFLSPEFIFRLAENNAIAILPFKNNPSMANTLDTEPRLTIYVTHDKTYRAVAQCYLLMKDAENGGNNG